tara:strand:- start:6238 stop:6477 length:240 start_codon:yes stop_codon:yes gene_type:complete
MLTSDDFRNEPEKTMAHIKMIRSVSRDGKVLRAGNVYEVTSAAANTLIAYRDAELTEAPKKKAAKKKAAKAKPIIEAER